MVNRPALKPAQTYQDWVDNSLCDPIQRRIPAWLPPNYISLLNNIVCWATFVLAFAIVSAASQQRYLVASFYRMMVGILTFASMVLDCMDGRHARATGQTSPLGECMDHGLDTINIQLISASLLVSCQLEPHVVCTMLCGSAMVYHGQVLLFRHTHVMTDAPTSGVIAQSITAVVHVAVAVLLAFCDRQSHGVQLIFNIVIVYGIVVQIENCYFYVSRLESSGLVKNYVIFGLISLICSILYLFGLVSQPEFIILYCMIAFRSTGLTVLFSVVSKVNPGVVLAAHTPQFDLLIASGLSILLLDRAVLTPIGLSIPYSPWLMSALIVFINLYHVYRCLPWLYRIEIKKE
uniref:CDP-alcohol phosphatidyltransferase n=1 Tax=Spongospora subterranea TaxID=70186 RepID=A0A0H5QM92_9EUKA|eukprot:CRZ03260.1 hypothetical protein [Spongospora subterranea]